MRPGRLSAFLLLATVSSLVGCGGSSHSSNQQKSVSIALNPAPASTNVAVGSAAGIQFTPVVSDDPGNYGVDWALTCSIVGQCGTLSIPTFHSASGTAVTYLPPSNFQTGSLTVNVTVFATADHTKNVSTPITVSSYTNVLKGTYVLQLKGFDGTGAYQTTGALVFDGNGNITSGEQTINSMGWASSGLAAPGPSAQYTVQGSTTPSTYFVGPDGRGTITLNVAPLTAPETFTFEILSSSEILISQFDLSSNDPTITATGTLELQDSSAAAKMPTGAYAFVTIGSDAGAVTQPGQGNAAPTAFGGVLNIDNNPSAGSISGNGSLADQDYYNTKITGARKLQSCLPPTGVTGSVSQPDSFGAVTITLAGATCFGIKYPATIQFTGYIVNATEIRLIEIDDVNGSGGYLTAGIAVGQGTGTAGTFTTASLSRPYVYGILGYEISNPPGSFAGSGFSFASAGVLNPDGLGNLTGITDTFFPFDLAAPPSGSFTATTMTGTYSVDLTGIGRAQLTPIFLKVNSRPHPTVLFYLTGNGTPALTLWANSQDGANGNGYPALGIGIAYPQAANASSLSLGSQAYGVTFTRNNGSENDGTGQMVSQVNGTTGTLTGTVDDFNDNLFNSSGNPFFPLSDTFSLPADSFGRIGGTFQNTPGNSGPFVEYYMIDSNHGFLVETDLATTNAVNLGYFATACDVTNAASCATAAKHSSFRRNSASSKLRRSQKNLDSQSTNF